MSRLKSRVGSWRFEWKSVPRGTSGKIYVQSEKLESSPENHVHEVSWQKDGQGIRINLPHGTFSFDLAGAFDDNGQFRYRVSQRNSHQEWNGVFSQYGDIEIQAGSRGNSSQSSRVRAQMPGKMIRVMVAIGAKVEKDQPIAVMEAMKMENEIRAPRSGKISQVKVTEGQIVETGTDLISIEGE